MKKIKKWLWIAAGIFAALTFSVGFADAFRIFGITIIIGMVGVLLYHTYVTPFIDR